ncbi:hypothetical protein D3C84_676670 [compost metagenome]
MFGAEIQHFLGFGDAANQGAGQYAAAHHQFASVYRWLYRLDQPHQNVHTVEAQGIEVGIEVVLHRNGVEQEVEMARGCLHLFGIGGDDDVVRTLAASFFSLACRSGE